MTRISREPTYDVIRAEAMRLWREREMQFPAFVRRMQPDTLDHESGAWDLMLAQASALPPAEAPDAK